MRKSLTFGLLAGMLACTGAGRAVAQTPWTPSMEEQRPFTTMLTGYEESAGAASLSPLSAGQGTAGPDAAGPVSASTVAASIDAQPVPASPVQPTFIPASLAPPEDAKPEACAAIPEHCCDDVGGWLYNTQVWFGGEAYKSAGDYLVPPGEAKGFMDSAGAVTGFNTGFGLGDSRVRAQLGATYGAFDFKGRDTEPSSTFHDSSVEQQVFLTGGLYKRSDVKNDDRISWGVVYDQFFGHQWGLWAGEVSLAQVRGILGYAVDECNEVGVWGTAHLGRDLSVFLVGTPPPIRAMDQANIYWRHNYDFGGSTMLYIGALDQASVGSWQLGALGEAPLSDRLSLYANYTYVAPSSASGPVGANEVQWDISVGLSYTLGAKSVADTVSGQPGLPLLPVANNGSFLITQ
ncbi:MAG: hypothetical protein K8T25_24110 [Planctomycetia bacterium]|nr:hypothetical protein [Planctomycetia bacterium]